METLRENEDPFLILQRTSEDGQLWLWSRLSSFENVSDRMRQARKAEKQDWLGKNHLAQKLGLK